jgi:hypothetical protein
MIMGEPFKNTNVYKPINVMALTAINKSTDKKDTLKWLFLNDNITMALLVNQPKKYVEGLSVDRNDRINVKLSYDQAIILISLLRKTLESNIPIEYSLDIKGYSFIQGKRSENMEVLQTIKCSVNDIGENLITVMNKGASYSFPLNFGYFSKTQCGLKKNGEIITDASAMSNIFLLNYIEGLDYSINTTYARPNYPVWKAKKKTDDGGYNPDVKEKINGDTPF